MKTAAGCARLRRCRRGKRSPSAARSCSAGSAPTRRPGFRIFEALVRDASGSARVAWFNSSFLQDQLHARDHLVLYGTLERNPYAGLQFTNPDFELIEADDADTLHTGRIVPVYERARSITPKMQRRLVADALLRLPAGPRRSPPGRDPHAPGLPRPQARARTRALPAGRHAGRRAQRVSDARAAAARVRGVLPLPGGAAAAEARIGGRTQGAGDARGRSHPRGAPGRAAVPPHARPARGAQGDRRRHAAPAPDEPPAAGRRRRGKDDCRGAGGGARDGERPAGRVHGAHRDPGRAALRDRAAAAGGHAVQGRPADGPPAGAGAPQHRARRSRRARFTSWWARMRSCRSRCGSRRSAW